MSRIPGPVEGTVLRLPERRSLGRVDVWDRTCLRWEPLAEARWTVVVPAGLSATLWVDRDVTDADLTPLASMPPAALHGLMAACPLVGDAGMKMVESLRGLTVLSVPGSGVTDAGLTSVGALRRLAGLNLSGCEITSAGIADLAGLRRLRTVLLRGTRVDDAVVETLVGLPELRNLHLSNSFLTDAGLAALVAVPTLRLLAINGTLVSADGVARLWTERPDIRLVAR